jgi:HNH endonuclease
MRPVNRGGCPKATGGSDVSFAEYKEARDPLISRIGDYCSYCEVCLHSSIDVEHVRPKKPQPLLALDWTNFLLACGNCNSIKGDEDVDLANYFWPDRDNTARIFDYDSDQPPHVSIGLDPALRPLAERTISLTGLDRFPGHPQYSDRDRRWLKRREAWGVALKAHRDLAQYDTPQMREIILHIALARGFWSVWFQVFYNDMDMRSRLITWFPGTAPDCFDANTRPVPRPGGRV